MWQIRRRLRPWRHHAMFNAWLLRYVWYDGWPCFFLCVSMTKLAAFLLAYIWRWINAFLSIEHIEKMGLAYRSAWVKGNMDRKQLQQLEDPQLLLLCLCPYAFEKADRASLISLSKDLGLPSMIKSAVLKWNLEAQYPMVRNKVPCSVIRDSSCFNIVGF